MTASLRRTGLLAVALVVWPLHSAGAASFVTWRNSGSPTNRVDLVVVAEGYTSSQMSKFQTDAATFLTGVFAQDPYKTYANYYNVYLLLTTSSQAGADHPERGSFVNTAFDATYNCGGIQRLICVATAKVNAAVGASFPSGAYHDQVIVLVNDAEYGGSGGAVAVASTNSAAVELVLHEVGHSFGLLADEYTSNPELCDTAEPSEANATTDTGRSSIKWKLWIASATPLPTTGTSPGVPGAYVGSRYCSSGMYRPTFNSKMRTLGQPFEQINTEQHVRRIYTFVSGIDSFSPTGSTITVGSSPVTFRVTPLSPTGGALTGTWSVDGVAAGSGMSFSSDNLPSGTHTLQAVVKDPSPMVRSDPNHLLVDAVTWNVSKSGGGGCAGTAFSGTITTQGDTQIQPNGSWYQSTVAGTHTGCLNGPAGADFDLFLDRWNGSAWTQVAASEGSTSVETIVFQGTAGFYRWRVLAFSGTGSYTFQLQRP